MAESILIKYRIVDSDDVITTKGNLTKIKSRERSNLVVKGVGEDGLYVDFSDLKVDKNGQYTIDSAGKKVYLPS